MVVNSHSRCGRLGRCTMTKGERSRRLDDVITDVGQPMPKIPKRNLVVFGVGYSPGNRRRCDCRSKFMKCPIKNKVSICNCPNKHECKCETKVPKRAEWESTNDNINDNVADGEYTKGSKSLAQSIDNGQNPVKLQGVDSQCVVGQETDFSKKPDTLQTVGSQDPIELKSIFSQNPVNNIQDSRKVIQYLCIAINQQVCTRIS